MSIYLTMIHNIIINTLRITAHLFTYFTRIHSMVIGAFNSHLVRLAKSITFLIKK